MKQRKRKDTAPAAPSSQVDRILKQVSPTPMIGNLLTRQEKIERIEKKFAEIMETLGLDLTDDSLAETPHRVAKMYVNELFSGLDPANFPKMTTVENKMGYDQMVVVQDIEVLSCCEHHFQTIEGVATVAYIPGKKVLGLSKLSRVVSFFARRPQVQERLTKQVADCLQAVLGSEDVAVHINAKHYCMIARGVEETHASTVTTDLRGAFKTCAETRQEFLLHCRHHGR